MGVSSQKSNWARQRKNGRKKEGLNFFSGSDEKDYVSSYAM